MTVKIDLRPLSEWPVHTMRYGDEVIRFERLPRASSKARILIKVHPDCRVQVRAPVDAEDSKVTAAVRKRARWISARLREFRRASEFSNVKNYVSGESHLYLGRTHILKLRDAKDGMESVKLFRGHFEAHTRSRNTDHVRSLFDRWYRERATDVFNQRLLAVAQQALWIDEVPKLSVRVMQTQWGSCSPNGRLTLNLHLVKAPRDCIDYVILHELCHVAEHNHSKRFYRLLRQVMPDWEKWKICLDRNAGRILPQ